MIDYSSDMTSFYAIRMINKTFLCHTNDECRVMQILIKNCIRIFKIIKKRTHNILRIES